MPDPVGCGFFQTRASAFLREAALLWSADRRICACFKETDLIKTSARAPSTVRSGLLSANRHRQLTPIVR